MNENHYEVKFTKTAAKSFAKLYNVDHENVFVRIKSLLKRPYNQSLGVADYPDFKFNGYHWTKVENAIIVFSIKEKDKKVRIRASYSALSGFAQQIFYGEDDPYEE
jgi:hypothetical protein